MAQLGFPPHWYPPGTRAPEGQLPRISTVDETSAPEVARRALFTAAQTVAECAVRGVADPAVIEQAERAFGHVVRLEPTAQQLYWREHDKLLETARHYLGSVDGSDASLLRTLERGLALMAQGVTCRVDEWSARDVELGRRLAGTVLGVYGDLARERGAA